VSSHHTQTKDFTFASIIRVNNTLPMSEKMDGLLLIQDQQSMRDSEERNLNHHLEQDKLLQKELQMDGVAGNTNAHQENGCCWMS